MKNLKNWILHRHQYPNSTDSHIRIVLVEDLTIFSGTSTSSLWAWLAHHNLTEQRHGGGSPCWGRVFNFVSVGWGLWSGGRHTNVASTAAFCQSLCQQMGNSRNFRPHTLQKISWFAVQESVKLGYWSRFRGHSPNLNGHESDTLNVLHSLSLFLVEFIPDSSTQDFGIV